MLEVLLTDINTKLSAMNIFSTVFGLCEIITKDGVSFPAQYCNNEWKQVSDFDKNNGTIYHRLTGQISISQDDEESTSGCDIYTTRDYPMKMVVCVKKNIYSDNDAFVEQRIAENIQSVIEDVDSKALRQALSADQIRVSVRNINVLRDSVFSLEYKNLSIDYVISISGNLSCYQTQGC
jgi:hypothetical protein